MSKENRRERTKGCRQRKVCSGDEANNLFSVPTGEKMGSNGLKLQQGRFKSAIK